MPHDEEQVRQLVRQMYQSAEEARWELEPEQVRIGARRRRFRWPEAKVMVLVGTAAALIVIGFAVAVGSGSHSSTPKRIVATPTTTPPTSLPPRHSTPATTAPTATSPSTTVPTTESASLSVVTCPTSFGYPTPTPATLPASVAVTIPRSLSGQLSVYSDTQGEMKLVGPSGWTCQALIGADGSEGEVVTEPGETVPPMWSGGWPLSPDSTVQAIMGSQSSACAGCTVGQACPLFSAAVTAYANEFGQSCSSRPASEAVQPINSDIVSFEDPPGVTGDGIPSGGRNPSNGVMTYYPVNENGSWLETCTLPTTEKDLCTTTLNSFIAWYGQN
jgi:Domain of unknown function (DUF4850)